MEYHEEDQYTHCRILKRRKEREMEKSLFEEIMAENIQIQEVQEIPIEVNPKESTSR